MTTIDLGDRPLDLAEGGSVAGVADGPGTLAVDRGSDAPTGVIVG